jgi:alpha-L-arabinofuranosidase
MNRSSPPLAAAHLAAALVLSLLTCTCLAGGAVQLNPQKTAEPISKYIYGQFVEHLGKSIYGGLWAEMLEDRKFFYPVSDRYEPYGVATDLFWRTGPYTVLRASPWKVAGPARSISMDKDHAYVGEHSVAVHLAGGVETGISQFGLTLVQGKQYTGRVVLAGDASAAPVIIRLSLDDKTEVAQQIDRITTDFQTFPLEFTAPNSTETARFDIVSSGTGTLRIGEVSLMPADNLDGWRPDVVAALKELDAPIFRWPGGNFVSGYDWRDGVNPNRDLRPPRHNPAWSGVEFNDVGIHEFMHLLDIIGAEPYVALNTGLGSVDNAAAEVEYLNGSVTTPMGKLRAANGHPDPFHIRYFAVGNEMFGNWQRGFMPLDQYVKKHNDVATAIWKADSTAQLVAVGQVGPWSQAMFRNCSDYMNLISEHIYCHELSDPVAHTAELADEIKRVADAHRGYRAEIDQLKGKNIRICMDEWNYWYGDYKYGELGCQYRLKDALGVARGLHEYFRNSDLFFMANYAQTINVLGCIKTSATAASLETTGLALEMYRKHFGQIPIPIAQQPAGLDVSAAWTADKSAITVAIVNCHSTDDQITFDCGDLALQDTATRWSLGGPDMESFNEPGRTPVVSIREATVIVAPKILAAPAQTAVIYRLEVR